MKNFTINISPAKILVACGTLVLSWISYISVQSINNGVAISALLEKHASDDRQDEELREIRRTIQDMTVLFFETQEEIVPERPVDFSAAQNAIENLIELRTLKKQ